MNVLKKPEFILCIAVLVIVIVIAVIFWLQLGQVKTTLTQGKDEQDGLKGNIVNLRNNQGQMIEALRATSKLMEEIASLRKQAEEQRDLIRKMAEHIDRMQVKHDDMSAFLKSDHGYQPRVKAKKATMAEEVMRASVVPVSAPPTLPPDEEEDHKPRSILKQRPKVTIKEDDDADDLVARATGH